LNSLKNGIQEVVGSIPPSSTNEFKVLEGFPSKPFFVGYIKENTLGAIKCCGEANSAYPTRDAGNTK
jgi:hypothetical protein